MLFTEADQQVLAVQRYLHPHPLVQRKMEALWLKSHNIDEKTILQLTSISRATLFRYYNDYREGGTEKLKQVNFHQPKSELDPHAQTLEAHFVLAPFLGVLWSFKRLFIKAPVGRERFNVLGALDAITHELVTTTNDTYINAQSVCDLLWKLHELHPKAPITLGFLRIQAGNSVLFIAHAGPA